MWSSVVRWYHVLHVQAIANFAGTRPTPDVSPEGCFAATIGVKCPGFVEWAEESGLPCPSVCVAHAICQDAALAVCVASTL